MTAIMSDAPTAATAKASKRFVGSQTNLTVHPKARSMPDMSILRFLNARRAYEDAVLLDGAPELDGGFVGDGIPRTAGGHEFEPLDWR